MFGLGDIMLPALQPPIIANTIVLDENPDWRPTANAIGATQRRANALKNVLIPRYVQTIKTISDALEDKEREEFTRMKIIKAQKQ